MFRMRYRLCSLLVEVSAILVLGAPLALSGTIASGDLIVTSPPPCCGAPVIPNVYQLDQTGAFKGWFFSPIGASDIAVSKSGQVLFASSNSGTIIETDTTGSFQGFVSTPISGINGLAVEANGDILAVQGSQLYQLDPTGKFLDLSFLPTSVNSNTSIGVDPQGEVVIPIPQQCCSNAPASLEFFNVATRASRMVPTGLSTISGLDVDENGNIWAIGSQVRFPFSVSIFELDSNGNVLTQLAGPQNPQLIAVANLPEPGTALLMALGLGGLAAVGRQRRLGV